MWWEMECLWGGSIGDDVGMRQNGCRFGLLLKKGRSFFGDQGFGEYFDGNLTFECLLESHEDGGHGAVTQLLEQYGRAHLLTDQVIQIEAPDG